MVYVLNKVHDNITDPVVPEEHFNLNLNTRFSKDNFLDFIRLVLDKELNLRKFLKTDYIYLSFLNGLTLKILREFERSFTKNFSKQ